MLRILKKYITLKKVILLISIFLVSFFSINVNAANVTFEKYADFNFDEFANKNLDFWTGHCSDGRNDYENCAELTLQAQKNFYTRLYKILSKYENKGLKINDAMIIMTVFYELNLELFTDDGDYYKAFYKTDKNAYNYDKDDDLKYFDPDDEDNKADIKNYLESETDTLKLLIKSMVGYEGTCTGISEGKYETKTVETKDENGNIVEEEKTILVCEKGIPTKGLENGKEVCASVIYKDLVGFWEKFAADVTGTVKFLGIESNGNQKCEEAAISKGYIDFDYPVARKQTVNEEYYWNFLTDSEYFDRKPHLQYYFAKVLLKTGHDNMWELSETEKKENIDLIKDARKDIIERIKEILELYNKNSTASVNYTNAVGSRYWWPIGSVTTTMVDGKLFANDEPEASEIVREYGYNYDELEHTYSNHTGIDIKANIVAGNTNIIAVSNGVVHEVVNNCLTGDDECGSGYGNYVVILHSNGVYTKYAHLRENTITVNEGEEVKQGQVIGKMGATGKTNGVILHFEVRRGTSKTSAVDPSNYVDSTDPRPASGGTNLIAMLNALEGTGPVSGDNYIVYCNSKDVPTVGHGITLTWNYDKFAQVGYPLSSSNGFYNYCGTPMPKSIVDEIFGLALSERADYVKGFLASNGISLEPHQVDALVSTYYNTGYIGSFPSAYQSYGATDALCTGWYNYFYINPPEYREGLINRRTKECRLFVSGQYYGVDY